MGRLAEIELNGGYATKLRLNKTQLKVLNSFRAKGDKPFLFTTWETFLKNEHHTSEETLKKEDKEKLETLRKEWSHEKDVTEQKVDIPWATKMIVDVDTFMGAIPGINFTVKKIFDHQVNDRSGDELNLLTALGRIERIQEDFVKAVQTFNGKVGVHIGGGLLLQVNDVQVLEDCCTDELQRNLNDGWRILSVCVQPDARRPDYVMGKSVID